MRVFLRSVAPVAPPVSGGGGADRSSLVGPARNTARGVFGRSGRSQNPTPCTKFCFRSWKDSTGPFHNVESDGFFCNDKRPLKLGRDAEAHVIADHIRIWGRGGTLFGFGPGGSLGRHVFRTRDSVWERRRRVEMKRLYPMCVLRTGDGRVAGRGSPFSDLGCHTRHPSVSES